MKTIHSFIWMVAFGLITLNGFANPIPPRPNPPKLVNDFAHVFTPQQIAMLEQKLVAFNDTTSNQIVIITLADLEGYQPYEVAYEIGDQWKVGQKEFDNGIVILFKPKTASSKGEVFIATGYGLEGAIPDITSKRIIEREMIPFFKKGDIYTGINQGVDVLMSLASGEYNYKTYGEKKERFPVGPVLFLAFVLLFVFLRKAGEAKSYSAANNIPFWTAMFMASSMNRHRGYYDNFNSGGGGFGGGSGGFGGFGGGGFGGGGAGGSW